MSHSKTMSYSKARYKDARASENKLTSQTTSECNSQPEIEMRLLLLCLAVGLLEVQAGGRRRSYSAAGRGGGRTVGYLVLANEELFYETHAQFKLYVHISDYFPFDVSYALIFILIHT